MADRGTRMFVLGLVVGGAAVAVLVGGATGAWKWRGAAVPQSHAAILKVKPAQGVPFTPREFNPREFVPMPPQSGQDQGPGMPSPGAGGQNCDKILYFFQGKLYQLRPGPMPKNGGNPEFYYMQPYEGPQIPGFPSPGPQIPGMPDPNMGPSTPRRI